MYSLKSDHKNIEGLGIPHKKKVPDDKKVNPKTIFVNLKHYKKK